MPEKRQNAEITSPCNHVCTLEFKTGFCYGCGRNMKEITQWAKFSNEERTEILNHLPERMKLLAE